MKKANRLANETSPYLLQHAHNPVEWYPWGPEALQRAEAEDKPILLSIGYSACHWCHVMERESFENAAIAALMNDHFVCIKVDREERPDLDTVYMAATLAINHGRGGWPMTVFLTPSGEPFFAGTYFPPSDRHGMPGFPRLLQRIAQLWRGERSTLLSQAAELTAALRETAPASPDDLPSGVFAAVVQQLRDEFDPHYGGFGPAPKFPHATTLSLLLRRMVADGDSAAAAEITTMVRATLDGMAKGGLFDHIGGGFARYSTDAQWLVPHFEKMLYDNALLAKVYVEAHQALGEPFYADVARQTINAMLRTFQSPEGGFYCATDADSEGEEGKYFVWQPDELAAILSADEAAAAAAYFDIAPGGNWEGSSIPNTPRDASSVAASLSLPVITLQARVEAARQKMLAARDRRVPPALDDKVLTAWNGLMIGALAEAARVLDEPRYLQAAIQAADFVSSNLRRPDGRLLRTWRAGKAQLDAYLEDYAYLAEGLVDLYEAGAHERYLLWARSLAEHMLDHFHTDGVFFDTAHDHEALLMRSRDGHDGATPSAHATAALTLARLSYHFDKPAWLDLSRAAIRTYARGAARSPQAFCKLLLAQDFVLSSPVEVALIGTPDDPRWNSLARAVHSVFLPQRVLGHGVGGSLPLLSGKERVGGDAAVYVCRNYACQAPLVDAAAVRSAF